MGYILKWATYLKGLHIGRGDIYGLKGANYMKGLHIGMGYIFYRLHIGRATY